jgi:hypothetical protein
MIVSRVKAGMERAKAEEAAAQVRRDAQGKRKQAIGRPKVAGDKEAAIQAHLASGMGMLRVAKLVGVGVSTVQRVAKTEPAPLSH